MDIKNLRELDFSSQRAIIGGASFGECTCSGYCTCVCDSSREAPTNSMKSEANDLESKTTFARTQRNNL